MSSLKNVNKKMLVIIYDNLLDSETSSKHPLMIVGH